MFLACLRVYNQQISTAKEKIAQIYLHVGASVNTLNLARSGGAGRRSYTNQPDWPVKDTFGCIHSVEYACECLLLLLVKKFH